MKLPRLTTKVQLKAARPLDTKTSVKLLVGIALGILLMAETSLPLDSANFDEPAGPIGIHRAVTTGQFRAPTFEQMIEIDNGFGTINSLSFPVSAICGPPWTGSCLGGRY